MFFLRQEPALIMLYINYFNVYFGSEQIVRTGGQRLITDMLRPRTIIRQDLCLIVLLVLPAKLPTGLAIGGIDTASVTVNSRKEVSKPCRDGRHLCHLDSSVLVVI